MSAQQQKKPYYWVEEFLDCLFIMIAILTIASLFDSKWQDVALCFLIIKAVRS